MIRVLASLALLILPQTAEAGKIIPSRIAGSDKLIIFVHGIFGDPESTFTSSGNPSWPKLMADDQASLSDGVSLSKFDTAMYGYDTPRTGRLSPEQIADQLLSDLKDHLRSLGSPYNDIFFIAHSMGGLITKRLLVRMWVNNDPLLKKIKGVILIATPSKGSPVANSAHAYLSLVITSRSIIDLKTIEGNTYLQSLANDWHDTFDKNPNAMPRVYCMYETQSIGPVEVVSQIYSEDHCTETPRAEQRTHLSIVKPESREDPIYLWTRGRITDILAALPARSNDGKGLRVSNILLFDEEKKVTGKNGFELTELEPRIGQDFVITSPERFLMAIGFVIAGFDYERDGATNLKVRIRGLDAQGQSNAWVADWDAMTLDDWKTRLTVAKKLGSEQVARQFHVDRSDKTMPLVFLVQCASKDDLDRWAGGISIEVFDKLAKKYTSDQTLTILLKKPKNIPKSTACR